MSISTAHTESAVLSSCLSRLNQGWFSHAARAGGNNPGTMFSDYRNRAVFEAIGSLSGDGRTPSIAGIIDRISSGGEEFEDPRQYVMELQMTPPMSTLDQFDSALEDLCRARSIRTQVRSMEQVLSDVSDPQVDPNPSDVALRLQEIIDSTDVVTDTETFGELTERILNSARPMWSVSTQIPSLNRVLGGRGLESGCLTIIAARPKVGKTVLMNTLVHNTLDEGAVPIVLNYETKNIEFVSKMISRYIADPDLNWGMVKGYLAKDEETMVTAKQIRQINDGVEWAKSQEWYVSFDKRMPINDIHALVAKTKAENPEGARIVLFVDYIQLQVGDSYHEREEITQLSRFYKKLAGEFEVSCVVLSQLNRNSRDGIPSVVDLRGSGSLEQDADTILLMDKPSRRDETQPKHILEIYAGTTRLAEGDTFELFIDGGTNIVSEMPEELIRENMESELLEEIV